MFANRTIVPAPHGQLEAIYKPQDGATSVALVLHPHPLYGGTMHNKVVVHAARALEEAGMTTLRINFRGVGASSGGWDEGRGEADDARVALDWLLARHADATDVVLAGFSFGASIALRVGCPEARVTRLISIATPGRWLDAPFLAACTKPIVFIHGDRDDVAPLTDLRRLLEDAQRSAPTTVHVVPGADHFFTGHLPALRAHVA